jgi:REP element-mobilizing transposase RayT
MRGDVENGTVLPGDPARFTQAVERVGGRSPVLFTHEQQSVLFDAVVAAANEFGYQLTDVSIESWHLHWIISHGYDPVPTMVGRLKNRMRQAMHVGRVWTEGYYDKMLFDESAVAARRRYIARHDGCRLTGGVLVEKEPPQSGGLMEGV